MFIEVLKNKKEVGPGLFFNYQVDEDNCLKKASWYDSVSKRSCAIFGDILSFDTTYRTNRCSMVFAPFTRLNHHRQLICIGTGLLRDEKVESFQWLFNNFLIAMGSNMLKTIVND